MRHKHLLNNFVQSGGSFSPPALPTGLIHFQARTDDDMTFNGEGKMETWTDRTGTYTLTLDVADADGVPFTEDGLDFTVARTAAYRGNSAFNTYMENTGPLTIGMIAEFQPGTHSYDNILWWAEGDHPNDGYWVQFTVGNSNKLLYRVDGGGISSITIIPTTGGYDYFSAGMVDAASLNEQWVGTVNNSSNNEGQIFSYAPVVNSVIFGATGWNSTWANNPDVKMLSFFVTTDQDYFSSVANADILRDYFEAYHSDKSAELNF